MVTKKLEIREGRYGKVKHEGQVHEKKILPRWINGRQDSRWKTTMDRLGTAGSPGIVGKNNREVARSVIAGALREVVREDRELLRFMLPYNYTCCGKCDVC